MSLLGVWAQTASPWGAGPPCGRPCVTLPHAVPSHTLCGSRQAPAAGYQLESYDDALTFLLANALEKHQVVPELPLWAWGCAG